MVLFCSLHKYHLKSWLLNFPLGLLSVSKPCQYRELSRHLAGGFGASFGCLSCSRARSSEPEFSSGDSASDWPTEAFSPSLAPERVNRAWQFRACLFYSRTSTYVLYTSLLLTTAKCWPTHFGPKRHFRAIDIIQLQFCAHCSTKFSWQRKTFFECLYIDTYCDC